MIPKILCQNESSPMLPFHTVPIGTLSRHFELSKGGLVTLARVIAGLAVDD